MACAALLALAGYAAAVESGRLADLVLDVLFLPVVATAFWFARRGAVAAAGLGAVPVVLLGAAGVSDLGVVLTHVVAYAMVGGAVGWSVETARSQGRRLERRHELSPELLATMKGGSFVSTNPVWERMLGYTSAELVGRDLVELVHPDDRELVASGRVRLARGETVTGAVVRLRHADGSYVWIEWSGRHDERDGVNYIAGRDVTARHEAEEMRSLHKEMLEKAVADRTSELQARTNELERLARELDLARREHLRRLAVAAEFRDDKTAQHTERVGITAALIARELGLPELDIRLIREAAPLHDIGKIGTPDAILLNPDSLTDAEWAVMQQHTHLGAKILGDSHAPVLRMAAEIALSHHEWWDGTGYPDGRRGEEIPLPARIVALADVLDALTHARPYKPAWTLERATLEIDSLSGRQFDPAVVEAFYRLDAKDLGKLLQLDGEDSLPARAAAAY